MTPALGSVFVWVIALLSVMTGSLVWGCTEVEFDTLYSTGTNDQRLLLPIYEVDRHYSVVGNFTGSYDLLCAADQVSQENNWFVEPSNQLSQWIYPSGRYVVDFYTYTTIFEIPPVFDVSTATITGFISTDDNADIYLNSKLVLQIPLGAWQEFIPITIPSSSEFVNGNNTLEFDIINTDGPTGLNALFTGKACLHSVVSELTIGPSNKLYIPDALTVENNASIDGTLLVSSNSLVTVQKCVILGNSSKLEINVTSSLSTLSTSPPLVVMQYDCLVGNFSEVKVNIHSDNANCNVYSYPTPKKSSLEIFFKVDGCDRGLGIYAYIIPVAAVVVLIPIITTVFCVCKRRIFNAKMERLRVSQQG